MFCVEKQERTYRWLPHKKLVKKSLYQNQSALFPAALRFVHFSLIMRPCTWLFSFHPWLVIMPPFLHIELFWFQQPSILFLYTHSQVLWAYRSVLKSCFSYLSSCVLASSWRTGAFLVSFAWTLSLLWICFY